MKNIIGVFLLPVAWVWTVAFFGLLFKEVVHHRFWKTDDFRFFSGGFLAWMLIFTGWVFLARRPPPLLPYVYGHEHTHAIWAWLSRGKVSEIKVEEEGGYILTNKPTFWVTLAPYFYPVYCFALIVIATVAALFVDLQVRPPGWWFSPLQIFFALMGVAWSFHLSFTVWMIGRGQSDLRMHGNFFSLVLIYTMNVAVLSLFLALSAPSTGFVVFGRELLHQAEEFSDFAWNLMMRIAQK